MVTASLLRRLSSAACLLFALALAAGAATWARAAHLDLPSFFTPQGRLVLAASSCAGAAPVMTADVPAATVACYVPYNGQAIIVGGAPYLFGTLTLAFSQTNHASGGNYDIWAVVSSGAVTLCAEGSLWSSTTARSGTPAFAGGVLTNPSPLAHCYNGSTDYGTVATNAATYLGTFSVPTAVATTVSSQTSGSTTLSVAAALKGAGLYAQYYVAVDTGGSLEYELVTAGFGTTTLTVTRGQLGTSGVSHTSAAVAVAGGQTAVQVRPAITSGGANPLIGLCNAYNLVPIAAENSDSAASWTYASAAWRQADASSANKITYLDCLGTIAVAAFYSNQVEAGASSSDWAEIGAERDWSSGNPSGVIGSVDGYSTFQGMTVQATNNFYPSVGLHSILALEYSGAGTTTFFGSHGSVGQNDLLTAQLEY